MDPNAVLTEEQRQIRFRKANERKIVDQNRRSSGNRSEASSDDEAGRLQRPSRSTLFPPLALEQQQQQQQQHQQQFVRTCSGQNIFQREGPTTNYRDTFLDEQKRNNLLHQQQQQQQQQLQDIRSGVN